MTTAGAAPTTRLGLPDGRSLDLWYDDSPGAEALTPLVFHAGTPTSGLPFEVFVRAARERGLRSIGWSRPGYGSSTRQPGRTVADVVPDTVAVLDHLEAGPAYVVGHSGGGPHALACAALLPDRVLGVALIAGVAPFEAELAAYLEPQRETILRMTGADVAAMFGDLVDDVDRGALTGEYAAFVAAQMAEGQRESATGWLDDDLAFVRPWGFDLASIRIQVHVWQGAHDRMVPFAHGQWLAATLGNPCVHLHPEHGHMSLAVAGYPAILDSLVGGT